MTNSRKSNEKKFAKWVSKICRLNETTGDAYRSYLLRLVDENFPPNRKFMEFGLRYKPLIDEWETGYPPEEVWVKEATETRVGKKVLDDGEEVEVDYIEVFRDLAPLTKERTANVYTCRNSETKLPRMVMMFSRLSLYEWRIRIFVRLENETAEDLVNAVKVYIPDFVLPPE